MGRAVVALGRFFEGLGLREVLRRARPDGRTSPNQIPVGDVGLTLVTGVLTGARRFAHLARLRADPVVQAILGVRRLPSAMTVTRYFGGFVRGQVEHRSEVVERVVLARLRPVPLGAVLDLDSTVVERYGHQEGSLKGHTPRKHGRPSHHPLLAMLAEAKVIVHAWLRSGNAGTASGVRAFLAETLARLPAAYRLYALRADSGFYVTEFLEELEARGLPYAIVVRRTRLVQRAVVGIRDWQRFAPGLDVAELAYQPPGWRVARRLVVVREELRERPEARGRRLLDAPGYTFHAIVTTLALPPAEVWRFSNSRTDSENRLKELKEDFGANGFCRQSFAGTEAVFRVICFLFTLIALFKHEVTRDEAPRLMTRRTQVLVVGAVLGAEGRRPVRRLGLRGAWRQRFAALLIRLARWAATVAQSGTSAAFEADRPLCPWRPRRRRPATWGPLAPASPIN